MRRKLTEVRGVSDVLYTLLDITEFNATLAGKMNILRKALMLCMISNENQSNFHHSRKIDIIEF